MPITRHYHQDQFATNLTSNQIAGVTTTPLNSIPSVTAPFYIALDANNDNGHFEIVDVTSKTATNINHAATTYAHTTSETVALVVPATEMDAISLALSTGTAGSDGWTSVSDTWTYASATTITVPSGAASLYQKGDRVKLTQTTAKYFVITAVADTLLTVNGGTDYTVANAAITSPYYSHQLSPLGYPDYFSYTPTGPTNTTLTGRFSVNGRTCFASIRGVLTGAPSFASMPTLPITASSSILNPGSFTPCGQGGYLDSGTANIMDTISPVVSASGTTCDLFRNTTDSTAVSATVPITWATNDIWQVIFRYEI